MTIQHALKAAREDGRIDCDSLVYYRRRLEVPEPIRRQLDTWGSEKGGFVVATRGDCFSAMWVADQLIEQCPLEAAVAGICEDLGTKLAEVLCP